MRRHKCKRNRGLVITLALTAALANLAYGITLAGCNTGVNSHPVAAASAPRLPQFDDAIEDAVKYAYVYETLETQRVRQEMAARIDAWLSHRGSPATGLGMVFAENQDRTGVSATLMVGVFDQESTCGTNGSWSRTNHNGFGMHGPRGQIDCVGGMCWWPDWSSGISGAFDFVRDHPEWAPWQVADDLRGYCAGHPAHWVAGVEYVRARI